MVEAIYHCALLLDFRESHTLSLLAGQKMALFVINSTTYDW